MPYYNTTPFDEVEVKAETGVEYTFNGTTYTIIMQYNDESQIEGTMSVMYLRNRDNYEQLMRVEVGAYEYNYHEIKNDDYDIAYLDHDCSQVNIGIRWNSDGYAVVIDQQPNERRPLEVGDRFGCTTVAIIEPDLIVLRTFSETRLYRMGNLADLPPNVYIEWRD